MNKQQLAAKIWESANQMRSKIEANEYKDYILGFIFYKYLSDKQLNFARMEDFAEEDIKALTEEDTETVNHFKKNIGYFIAYDDLFSTWIEKKQDFDVANVRDALSAFSRLISPAHKKLFDGIFETLETGLSKLGESAAKQTKAISDLLHLIKNIPMNGKQDYDVLGFIYEYLIEKFAANAGKKAGEFYTPHEVSLLMSEIVADHLKDRKEIQIYDSCSGSGSLLINIGNSVAKHMDDKNNIKYFAQELKKNTYNLTRMNLVMRDILPNNIATRNGDTLEDDWPYFDENDPVHTYNTLYVDAVVSNPPYSQKWDRANKDSDPRYSRFGLAPKTKADYAFLLHDLYHIKPDGIMTIVLPHGVLYRGGEEGTIRKKLIEANHIDAIIGLPSGVFFGTNIPTVIIVLKQKRENTDVLVVDASKGFIKEGKNNKLRGSDVKKIVDTVSKRKTTLKLSRVVNREELRDNDYNLNLIKYVDSSEPTVSYDIYASMFGGMPTKEIDQLMNYWSAFSDLRESLFSANSEVNFKLKVDDIKETITNHSSVQEFVNSFDSSFSSLANFLKVELLNNIKTVKVSQEKTVLSDDIFNRLENIPLVDKYKAYQALDDEWDGIKVDLEIIQTEGFEATKVVDPNMIIKKKKGKDQEVQDGWIGRIIPFDLVQETYLCEELTTLKNKENRLLEIASEFEELLDSLSEEEKEEETVNEDKDGFVNALVVKEAKELKKELKENGDFEKDSYEFNILAVDKLITEEKKLKKEFKSEAAALHLKTKATIEELSDGQVYELLEMKWVHPIVGAMNYLPQSIINNLTTKIRKLYKKYKTTFVNVSSKINQTEKKLSAFLEDLEGNEYAIKGMDEFKSLSNLSYNQLSVFKKSMLELMFPKDGNNKPAIRFKGFEQPWEKSLLNKLVDFHRGKGLSWDEIHENGKFKCILYGHLYTTYGMVINEIQYSTNSLKNSRVFSKKGDVLIPSSDTTPTGLARASSVESDNIILGGDINVLRPNNNVLGSFLSFNLNSNKNELIKLIKGTTVKHIYNSDLKDIELYTTTDPDEQNKISELFQSIDTLIELHTNEIQDLKSITDNK